MGLFKSIKNFFNERAQNGRDLSAIYKATELDDIGAILAQADARITKYKLQPITQGSQPADQTLFESGLGELRTAARSCAVRIGLGELSMTDSYHLLTSMRSTLSDTIASIGRDQMTSNAFYSMAASSSIDDCHKKIGAFVQTWAALPEHVRAVAPQLNGAQNPNSTEKIEKDGFWELVGVVASLDVFNMSSRAQIKEAFQGFEKKINRAITQMEDASLMHLAQRDPQTITRVMSSVVRDQPTVSAPRL